MKRAALPLPWTGLKVALVSPIDLWLTSLALSSTPIMLEYKCLLAPPNKAEAHANASVVGSSVTYGWIERERNAKSTASAVLKWLGDWNVVNCKMV
ncbi:hypothetical protein BLTE_20930 [Blastochloris tepida]|uniref:Uncharacterized protein n=1 Tax=Blastochloris tepida TaxID=2233851 RepID=A0A348G1H5_9HYPH|nr:hypothetical protein BLTE_20930 [Blastochloris tepida]